MGLRTGYLIAFFTFALHWTGLAGPLDSWKWVYPSPQGNDLYGVAYCNNRFIAVGAYETIITSSEGTNWILNRVGGPTNLQAVAYGNGTYVAVGERGLILTSPDAVEWTRRVPYPQDLFSVDFGNGTFVAVGGNSPFATNFMITSVDGVNWTQRAPPAGVPQQTFKDVVWANNQFVAVNRTRVIRSTDGILWQTNQMPSTFLYELDAVTFGDDRWIATGPYTIARSTNDAASWQTASNFVGHYNSGVAYGNGRYIIVGNSGIAGHSTNGLNWVGGFSSGYPSMSDIAFANGRFVTVGQSGLIMHSLTGTNWTLVSEGPRGFAQEIAGGPSGIAVSDSYGIIRQTDDLYNWRTVRTNVWVNRLAYLNHTYIGVAQGVITVGSGTWTNIVPPVTNHLWDVAFGNGLYVVSGDRGAILTAPDPRGTWTVQPPVSTNDGRRIAFGNGRFLTLNYNGDVALSPDGQQWSFHPAVPSASGSSELAFGNGVFIAIHTSGFVVDDGLVLASRDGLNWSRQIIATNAFLHDLQFANGIFLIAGELRGQQGGVIFDSRDGTNWTRRSVTNLTAAYASGPFGRTFVLSGWRGVLLQSGLFPMLWTDRRIYPQFILDAHPGAYRIEGTDNLGPGAMWDLVTNVTIANPQIHQWVGTNPPSGPRRFYRAVLP
jgi:hypothetical protein